MQDRPDDPEGAPAPDPRGLRAPRPKRKTKKKRRFAHRLPWAGLPMDPLGMHAFAPAPAARALVIEAPSCRVVLGLDLDGRLVGAAVFRFPAEWGGEEPEPESFGWGHAAPPGEPAG